MRGSNNVKKSHSNCTKCVDPKRCQDVSKQDLNRFVYYRESILAKRRPGRRQTHQYFYLAGPQTPTAVAGKLEHFSIINYGLLNQFEGTNIT